MSEMEYNKCDMECEKIFADKHQERVMEMEAGLDAYAEEMRMKSEWKRAALDAKRRQAYRECCWIAAFVSGSLLSLCIMYIIFGNGWMAVWSGGFSAMFGFICNAIEHKAYDYVGKRERKA